jgi:hypothetical protein
MDYVMPATTYVSTAKIFKEKISKLDKFILLEIEVARVIGVLNNLQLKCKIQHPCSFRTR